MCQQMEQLAIIDIFPEDLEQCESVINAAIDICSASMIYLAINICHQATLQGAMSTTSLRIN